MGTIYFTLLPIKHAKKYIIQKGYFSESYLGDPGAQLAPDNPKRKKELFLYYDVRKPGRRPGSDKRPAPGMHEIDDLEKGGRTMTKNNLGLIKGLVKNEMISIKAMIERQRAETKRAEASLERLQKILEAIEAQEVQAVSVDQITARFISEVCFIDPGTGEAPGKLFNAFDKFREDQGVKRYIKRSLFLEALTAAGYDVIEGAIINGRRAPAVWGIGLKGRTTPPAQVLEEVKEGIPDELAAKWAAERAEKEDEMDEFLAGVEAQGEEPEEQLEEPQEGGGLFDF